VREILYGLIDYYPDASSND